MNGMLAALVVTCLAAGQTLTKSGADFSSTQGHKGWFYGHYDGGPEL